MTRLLIKISGEMLQGSQGFGVDPQACSQLAKALHQITQSGYQVGVVIGGGNLFRGINLNGLGMSRTPADQIGMLATLMNGVALQQALANLNCNAKVMSALDCPKVATSYNWYQAMDELEKGTLLLFVGGTGNPYFTTDTAAALRASEIQADILLKATKVDGVYSKDPLKHSDAKKYTEISYHEYLNEKLGVMDTTAIALCMTSKTPIFVFNMNRLLTDSIENILNQTQHGTFIKG